MLDVHACIKIIDFELEKFQINLKKSRIMKKKKSLTSKLEKETANIVKMCFSNLLLSQSKN